MKTIRVKLRQDGDMFKVVSFSNTAQLSIGLMIPRTTIENWAGMARVQCEVIGNVEKSGDIDGDDNLCVTVQTGFDQESGGDFALAREWDRLAIELAPALELASPQTIDDAMQPDAGVQPGTMGVKGNIARSEAIAIIRRNTCKELGLNPDMSGSVSYRADNLGVLRAFSKRIAESQAF